LIGLADHLHQRRTYAQSIIQFSPRRRLWAEEIHGSIVDKVHQSGCITDDESIWQTLQCRPCQIWPRLTGAGGFGSVAFAHEDDFDKKFR